MPLTETARKPSQKINIDNAGQRMSAKGFPGSGGSLSRIEVKASRASGSDGIYKKSDRWMAETLGPCHTCHCVNRIPGRLLRLDSDTTTEGLAPTAH